jgi:two-component system sensor histidine kinase KdpD
MPRETQRKTPEEILREVEAQEAAVGKGRLKIFVGYASGVGKSFRMLDEARRRRERGQDVVMAAVQAKLSEDVKQMLTQFEVIPPLRFDSGDAIDVQAVLRRQPDVCLVDELAHTNPPESRNHHRWQDVEQILEAGVSVVTAVNLHHIQELKQTVQQITGKEVRDTVPKAFLMRAEEIVVVDVPTDQILDRLGQLRESERLVAERRLSELREMALLLAAEVVDHQLASYVQAHGAGHPLGTQEKILVCVTPQSNARAMITSGYRNAQRFHGELIVVSVRQPALNPEALALLESHLAFAREVGARVEILEDRDPIAVILSFARENGITQIFIGHSLRRNWRTRIFGGPVDRLIREAEGMDIRIFPH